MEKQALSATELLGTGCAACRGDIVLVAIFGSRWTSRQAFARFGRSSAQDHLEEKG